MKGGRSHYSGPGKGSQKADVSKPHGVKGSYKQPSGKVNPNPKGHTKSGLPISSRQVSGKRVSIHDMVF